MPTEVAAAPVSDPQVPEPKGATAHPEVAEPKSLSQDQLKAARVLLQGRLTGKAVTAACMRNLTGLKQTEMADQIREVVAFTTQLRVDVQNTVAENNEAWQLGSTEDAGRFIGWRDLLLARLRTWWRRNSFDVKIASIAIAFVLVLVWFARYWLIASISIAMAGYGVYALTRKYRVAFEGIRVDRDIEELGYGIHAVDPQHTRTRTVCLERVTDEQRTNLDPKHTVSRRPPAECDNPDQWGAELFGPAFAGVLVARCCLNNAENAVYLRHGVKQPGYTKKLVVPCALKRAVAHHFPFYLASADETWLTGSFGSWDDEFEIHETKWSRSKALQIIRSMWHEEVMPGRVKGFVKREISKIVMFGEYTPLERARLIQAYYNLSTQEKYAREFQAFQKALCAAMPVDCPFELFPGVRVCIASGVVPDAIAEWMDNTIQFADWWYERDGKSWDAFVNKMMHDAKTELMRSLGAVGEDLAGFADECWCVDGVVGGRGLGSGCLKYRFNGTVKSGQNDTSSGNSLINALVSASAMHLMGLEASIIVAGDDMLAGVKFREGEGYPHIRDLADKVAEHEKAYGIKPEYRAFESYTHVTFISGCWIEARLGKTMFVPLLGRLLAKLWWSVSVIRPSRRLEYVDGVRMGMTAVTRGLPLYSDFLKSNEFAMVELCCHHYTWNSLTRVDVDVAFAKAGLASRYNITEGQLEEFAEFLRGLPDEPCLVRHPVGDIILCRDLADLPKRPV